MTPPMQLTKLSYEVRSTTPMCVMLPLAIRHRGSKRFTVHIHFKSFKRRSNPVQGHVIQMKGKQERTVRKKVSRMVEYGLVTPCLYNTKTHAKSSLFPNVNCLFFHAEAGDIKTSAKGNKARVLSYN